MRGEREKEREGRWSERREGERERGAVRGEREKEREGR